MSNRITIVMMYYESPDMLRKQLEYWREYPEEVSDHLQVVMVDDGSPEFPAGEVLAEEVLPAFPVSLYRATENIIYNHSGGLNLAFTHVDEGWVLMTDMDHIMPEESLKTLISMDLNPNTVYRFGRRRMLNLSDSVSCKRHLDSVILTKAMFWKAGGFNEDFRGYWNGVSELFRKALKRSVNEIVQLDDIYSLLFSFDVMPDSGNVVFGKKGSEYDIHTNPQMHRMWSAALVQQQRPKNHIRFQWEQVI